jgi:hypothetical protein
MNRCAENVRWKTNAVAGEAPWVAHIEQKQDLPGFFQALGEHLDFTTFAPLSFANDGPNVVVRLNVALEVKMTGKLVQMEEVHWWTLDPAGKVSTFTCFHDSSQMKKAWQD